MKIERGIVWRCRGGRRGLTRERGIPPRGLQLQGRSVVDSDEGDARVGETLDRGSGSGLSVQGDEEGPHPPRFIDRVTPLAGALANFPPYLRSPITLFLQRVFFSRCTERWSALRVRVSAFPLRKRCRDICDVELETRWLRDKDDSKVYH